VDLTATLDASGSSDSDGTITNYLWDFGDGTSAEGVSTTHTYGDSGTFNITLTVTDNDGATNLTSTSITVTKPLVPPTASLALSTNAINEGGTINFDASGSTSESPIPSYAFDFGDGNTLTGISASVSHTYTLPGVYNASLTVTNSDGLTDTSSAEVTVAALSAPLANFKWSIDGTAAIFYIYPELTETGATLTSATFTFSDGSSIEASNLLTRGEATKDFGAFGDQSVTLNLTDSNGKTATVTKNVSVVSEGELTPVIDFEAIQSAPNTVFVSIVDSFDPLDAFPGFATISWGDGTVSTIDELEILSRTHSYALPGTYDLTVSISSFANENSSSLMKSVTVTDAMVPLIPPTANFVAFQPDSEIAGKVRFINQLSASANGNLQFLWAFPDGTTQSGPEATKFFAPNSSNLVSLTVTDGAGLTDSQEQLVSVGDGPDFGIDVFCEGTPDPGFYCEALALDSQGQLTNIHFDWGDNSATNVPVGGEASFPEADHLYIHNGLYTVTATAETSRGEMVSTQTVVNVFNGNELPSTDFNCTTNGLEINCDGSNSIDPEGGALSYSWDMGDGTIEANTAVISHTYASSGTYSVNLVVTDSAGGNSGPLIKVFEVIKPNILPIADIFCESLNLKELTCNPRFSQDSDGTIVSYVYTFDDGTVISNSDGSPVTHLFSTAGVHNVGITVTDNDGGAASATANYTLLDNQAPLASFICSSPSVRKITCDANQSSDPNGDNLTYSWNFNGEGSSTGLMPNFSFSLGGVKTIGLTVTDTFGATNTSTQEVSVLANTLPVLTINCSSIKKLEVICS
ncbi:MAG: PKD domain-containing protein, partial [Polaribacter sp.]|nr:PKD domain-containing protein [Polaribacter sp.]